MLMVSLILTLGLYGQNENLLKYYRFHKEQIMLFDEIRMYDTQNLSETELQEYIKKCEQLTYIGYSTSKHYYMAHAYKYFGDKEKAIYHIQKAFETGHVLSSYKTELFSDIFGALEIIYPSANEIYLNSINLDLQAIINDMRIKDQLYRGNMEKQGPLDSLNAIRLKEIVEEYGWPGRALVGNREPRVIVVHLSEEYNYYFLEHIIESCGNNMALWNDAEMVMTNMLWRFEKKDNHNKLRYLFIDDKGSLDLKYSYLLLNTLGRFLFSHPGYAIELYRTDLYPNEEIKILAEIKEFLIDYGVDERQVIISKEIIPAVTDDLGEYFVAYRRMSSRL